MTTTTSGSPVPLASFRSVSNGSDDPCAPRPTPEPGVTPDPSASPSPHPNLCPAQPGADPISLLAWAFTPIFQILFLGLAFIYSLTYDIGISIIVWLLMGALIVTQRIPSFIVTLAGMLVFRGLQWKVINSSTIPVAIGGQDNALSALTTWFGFPLEPGSVAFAKWFILAQLLALFTLVCNQYRGMPLSVVLLAVTAVAIGVLTGHTRFGRYLYAIGGNKEAAVVSGVPVTKVLIGVFGIMGLLVALGGFLQSAYAGANTTNIGMQLELDAVAACVIGGTSLKGGKGTVMGVIFGGFFLKKGRVLPLVIAHTILDVVAFVGYALLKDALNL